jgi:DNA-directed RNA polymerase II subunit RPB2
MNLLSENNCNEVLKSFCETKSPADTQINSFNHFIQMGLPTIITGEEFVIDLDDKDKKKKKIYKLVFGDVYVTKPTIVENQTIKILYPHEARLRDLNYVGTVTSDMTEYLIEKTEDNQTKIISKKFHARIPIAKLPIMLNSCCCNLTGLSINERIEKGECEKDVGGYFVIKGNERVLLGQIRGNYNNLNISYKEDKVKKYYLGELRSMSEATNHSVLLQFKLTLHDKKITIISPHITEALPIGILLKAYGYGYDYDELKNIINCKSSKALEYINTIMLDSIFIKTQEQAIEYMCKFLTKDKIPKDKKDDKKEYIKQILDIELLPHMSIISCYKKKAYFIGRIINKLISTVIGIRLGWNDERDNIANKRIETAGILFYELFTSLFKRYINQLILQLTKKKDNISIVNNVISNISIITSNFQHCLATGNWGVKKNSYIRTGVSQVLSRMTYSSFISHLRRTYCPVGKEANIKIRQINGSQFGFICPSETPEGETAGVVLNLALMCEITNHIPTILVKEALLNSEFKYDKISDIKTDDLDQYTVILLNEDIIGFTKNPREFVKKFRELRSYNFIHPHVSIIYDYMDCEIRICSDKGRCIRPLFVCNKNTKPEHFDWNYLVKNGFIAYLDCNEVEWSYVALYPHEINNEHDYCEIHPIVQLGNIASCIPFPDHSQAPRNVYQSSMMKQSLGMFSYSYKNRTDTMAYVMWYPQRPLITTKVYDYTSCIDMPSGIQCIVMIGTMMGFNQEDSLVINRHAIERGLFVTTTYRTITEIIKKKDRSESSTCIPPPSSPSFKRISNNYSLLNSNGVVKVGAHVKKGDVIIGKVLDINGVITDCSIMLKSGEDGVVDKVYINTTLENNTIIKIVIRQLKIPEPGDKFAARSAQKGTCSIVLNQEDMPFSKDGIIPDIIINPNCIPSRMTINQLLECVLGKYCALAGEYGDCTPFSSASTDIADKIVNKLKSFGFQGHGNETMTNGMTGEVFSSDIFIGPTYYQRLKHIVKNKMHARAQGAVTNNTRQPLEGRNKDGGLRVGEMERDCLIAHGTSEFLKDRLFTCSDPFQVILCKDCGCILSNQTCSFCGKDETIKVNIPYACKTLIQQLQSMCIKTVITGEL